MEIRASAILFFCFVSEVAAQFARPSLDWEITTQTVAGATWEVLLIETVAGVNHRVERSTDLLTWSDATDEVYGFGQQLAVALREVTPAVQAPSPPSGGSPPVSTSSISVHSVTLQPSLTGGIVVTLVDTSTSFPHKYLMAGQLDSGWNQSPLAVWQFEDQMLVTLVPGLTAIAVPTLSEPSLEHQTILDLLLAKFAEMNTTQAANAAQQVNAPVPPPQTGERNFFRIVTNWSRDSDGDGSLDWMEFAHAASPPNGANGQAGVVGDAFNGDTNGDGILDGQQLDTDGDGRVDTKDAVPDNARIDWLFKPTPRYALFPQQGIPALSFGGEQSARSLNARGEVLYDQGIWRAGQYHSLPAVGGNGITANFPIALADDGSILGYGLWESQQIDGSFTTDCYIYWPNVTTPPLKAGGASGFLSPISYAGLDQTHPGVLSGAGQAIALQYRLTTSQNGSKTVTELIDRRVFSIDAMGNSTIGAPTSYPYEFVAGTSEKTYLYGSPLNTSSNEIVTQIQVPYGSVRFTSTQHLSSRLYPASSPGMLVARPGRHPETISDQTPWGLTSIGPVELFGGNGLAYLSDGQFWFQGQTADWPKLMPGFPPNESLGFISLGRGGHILAEPIVPNSTESAWLGSPFSVGDDEEFTGVDATSLTSSEPGPAGDRYWVMVPAHAIAEFQLFSAAGPSQHYQLTNSSLNFLSDDFADAEEETFSVNADNPSTLNTAIDEDLELKLTDGTISVTAVNSPIGITLMPRRTLTVAVWPVAGWKIKNGIRVYDERPNSGANEAFRAKLEEQLNEIFGKQVNAFFTVTLKDMLTPDWDIGIPEEPGFPLEGLLPGNKLPKLHDQQMNINSDLEKNAITSEIDKDSADLHVFVMPYLMRQHPSPRHSIPAAGFNDVVDNPRVIFISGFYPDSARKQLGLALVSCHEIGHEFNLGHPNEGRLPAPLPGTNHRNRLMAGAEIVPNASERKTQLVKAEWDNIAIELKLIIDSRPLPPLP